MPRPQFTIRALLVAILVVGAFFGGVGVGAKWEYQRLADERAELKAAQEQLAGNVKTIQRAFEYLNGREGD